MSFGVASVDEAFADSLRWHLGAFRLDRSDGSSSAVRVQLVASGGDGANGDVNRHATEDGRRYSLAIDNVVKATHGEDGMEDILMVSLWEIWRTVSTATRDFLLLHAGAVARSGRALLMPASMQSGKSSLTLALLREGFSFLSDEYGAIDPVTGRLYPVPRPIGLRPWFVRRFEGLEDRLADRSEVPIRQSKRYVRPRDVGAEVAGPSEIASIVFPTPDFDGPPRLTEVSKAGAIEGMTGSCFNMQYYDDRGVILLARVADAAPAYRLEGGTPEERAGLLADMLG